jgi:ATP-dependent RNA helicase DeaD
MKIEFNKLNLSKSTLNAISEKGYETTTEIQGKIIPIILEQKSDIIGIAQTGTGKTGAFGIPLIDMIDANNKIPQAIILTPTRELALQVTSELKIYSGRKKLSILTVYGGSSINNQIDTLKSGVDIVVGTPGRVIDLIERKKLKLNGCKYLVLDEADEMLKMGFIEDIETILSATSDKKKVYLFSATMPERIKQLSKKYMKKQIIIEVEKKHEVSNLIEHIYYKANKSDKFDILRKIIQNEDFFYGIVFCRTKADVDNISEALQKTKNEVGSIHGDIAQNKREKILKKFKEQKLNILVATDVAARGIDVKNLSHVINYTLPEDVETYTHRIGRTGRAGNTGKAISIISNSDVRKISNIEKTLKIKMKLMDAPVESEKSKIENKESMVNEIEYLINKKFNQIKNNSDITKSLMDKNDPETIINALLYKIESIKNKEIKLKEPRREYKSNSFRNNNRSKNDYSSRRQKSSSNSYRRRK